MRYSEFAGFFPGRMDSNGMERVLPVMRIRDFYPGSRILTLIHPGSRIQQWQQNRGKKFAVLPFL